MCSGRTPEYLPSSPCVIAQPPLLMVPFRRLKVCTLFYLLLIFLFLSMTFLCIVPNSFERSLCLYFLSGTPSVPYAPIHMHNLLFPPICFTLVSPFSIHSCTFLYMCITLPLCL